MRYLWTKRNLILHWGLAFLLAAGAFGFCGMEAEYDTVVYLLTVYALSGLVNRMHKIEHKRIMIPCLLFSLLLSASFAVGRQVDLETVPFYRDMILLDWAYFLPFCGFVFVCVLNLTDWILENSCRFSRPEKVSAKYWAKAFVLITLCWIPYFMVFYPGNVSLDSFEVIQQAMGVMPYASNHPVAFTAAVSVFMRLGMLVGDINFGISCYSMVQLLVLAGILSYALYWMKKKGVPGWVILISGGYYALNPLIATFSVVMLKDTLFSGCILLLMTFLYDVYESGGELLRSKKGLAMLSGISVFISLWRNGIVAGVCILMLVLILCYKKQRKQLIPAVLIVLCLIFVILGPIYGSMDLPGSHAAESLGIPLQQIACTIAQNGDIDEQSREFLDRIMPISRWAEAYTPGGSDGIKFAYDFNTEFLDENTGAFFSVWLKTMPKNLGSYGKAWLMNTLGYYHIGTSEDPVWYGIIPADGVEQMQIFRTDLIHALTGTDLPARIIEAFIFYIYDLPVFNLIYSIGASVWLVFLCLVVFCLRRRKREFAGLWLLIPFVALWAIMMAATPVSCSFRYMLAFHFALPQIILLLFWNAEPVR